MEIERIPLTPSCEIDRREAAGIEALRAASQHPIPDPDAWLNQEIKRNLLREPIFMTTVHKRMARMYLGKATIEEVFSEIEQSKTQVKLQ